MTVLFAHFARPARLTAVVLAVALLLAACGGGDSDQAAVDTTAGPRETAAPSTPAAADARVVEHVYGETIVPASPQRVVVLHSSTILATALHLDVPVIATAYPPSGEGLVDYLPAGSQDLENIGWIGEYDLEKMARLEPDLIIGNTGFIREDTYPLLQEIAPTVAFEMFGSADWKEAVRTAAAAFGGEVAIEEDIAQFETRVAEFRAAMDERPEDIEVSILNFRAPGEVHIYTHEWCAGQVLAEAGLAQPDYSEPAEGGRVIVSIERLPDVDADVILYFVGSSGTPQREAEDAAAEITSNPLWGQLGAVQSGRAHQVDATHWFTCGPLEAQHLVLDDLFRLLVEGGP